MFPNFPPPYPEESIYSIMCRWRIRLGYNTEKFNGFLGVKLPIKNATFPIALRFLASGCDLKWEITARRLVDEHSIIPFYAPFNPRERMKYWNRAVIEHGPRRVGRTSMAKTFHPIKCCVLCARQDREDGREPYYRRAHQVTGSLACSIHKVLLSEVEPAGVLSYVPLTGYPELLKTEALDTPEILSLLAQDIEHARAHWSEYQGQDLVDALESADLNRQLRTNTKWNETLRRYVAPVSHLLPPIPIRRDKFEGMISPKSLAVGDPHRFLLLVRALGLTPDDLFKERRERQPLPRWPCRNPICGCFGKVVIAEQEAYEPDWAQYVALRCPHCSFAYLIRRKHASTGREPRQLRVKDFGPLWNERFRRLWPDRSVSFLTIQRQFGYGGNSPIYLHCAEINGLSMVRIGVSKKNVERYCRAKAEQKKLIAESRRVLEQLKQRIPDLTPNVAKQKCRSHCQRLFRYDYRWWSEFLNVPDTRRMRFVRD